MPNGVPAGLLALAGSAQLGQVPLGRQPTFQSALTGSLGLLSQAQQGQGQRGDRQFDQMLQIAEMEQQIRQAEAAQTETAQKRAAAQAYVDSLPEEQKAAGAFAPEVVQKEQAESFFPDPINEYQRGQAALAQRKQQFDEGLALEKLALDRQKAAQAGATPVATIRGYQKDFDAASKPFVETKDRYRRLNSGLDLGSRTGDATAVYNLQSLVDPGSVTREGDIVILQPGKEWVPGLRPYVEQLTNRRLFTDGQREELREAATAQFVPLVQSHALFRDQFTQDLPGDVPAERFTKDYLSDVDSTLRQAAGLAVPIEERSQRLGVSQEDLAFTAKQEGMTIEQVLDALEGG